MLHLFEHCIKQRNLHYHDFLDIKKDFDPISHKVRIKNHFPHVHVSCGFDGRLQQHAGKTSKPKHEAAIKL